MDVICLASLMGLAFILQYDTIWTYLTTSDLVKDQLSVLVLVFKILVALGIAFIVLAYIFRKKIMAMALYKKIEQIALGFWEGIKTIADLKDILDRKDRRMQIIKDEL